MKKSAKENQTKEKPMTKPAAADKQPTPAAKPIATPAERARQRVESSRKAAMDKAVADSPE